MDVRLENGNPFQYQKHPITMELAVPDFVQVFGTENTKAWYSPYHALAFIVPRRGTLADRYIL